MQIFNFYCFLLFESIMFNLSLIPCTLLAYRFSDYYLFSILKRKKFLEGIFQVIHNSEQSIKMSIFCSQNISHNFGGNFFIVQLIKKFVLMTETAITETGMIESAMTETKAKTMSRKFRNFQSIESLNLVSVTAEAKVLDHRQNETFSIVWSSTRPRVSSSTTRKPSPLTQRTALTDFRFEF